MNKLKAVEIGGVVNPKVKIIVATRPTPLQEKAFKLLGVSLPRTQWLPSGAQVTS